MRLGCDFRKVKNIGMWYCAKRRTAKFKVSRRGARGRRPFVLTVFNVAFEEAVQKFWAFRKFVLENDCKPGAPKKRGVFDHMPTCREYLSAYPLPGLMNEKTRRDQNYILKRDILPELGDLPLDRITFAEIESFQNQLLMKKLSPYSVVQKMTVLRKILRHACDNEILERMPKFPTRPRLPQTQLEVNDADVVRFLQAFDNPQSRGVAPNFHDALMRESRPFFTLAAFAALAFSDLRTLRWSDIDFERGIITRIRNKTSVTAVIPLTEVTLAAIQEVRSRPVVSSEFVLVTRAGIPYSVTSIRRYFKRAKQLAGITKRFRLHDLRHAALTRAASRGLPSFMIKTIAGHARISTSERYVHDLSAEAIEMIRKALR